MQMKENKTAREVDFVEMYKANLTRFYTEFNARYSRMLENHGID